LLRSLGGVLGLLQGNPKAFCRLALGWMTPPFKPDSNAPHAKAARNFALADTHSQ
jgi:hypothetical protein